MHVDANWCQALCSHQLTANYLQVILCCVYLVLGSVTLYCSAGLEQRSSQSSRPYNTAMLCSLRPTVSLPGEVQKVHAIPIATPTISPPTMLATPPPCRHYPCLHPLPLPLPPLSTNTIIADHKTDVETTSTHYRLTIHYWAHSSHPRHTARFTTHPQWLFG